MEDLAQAFSKCEKSIGYKAYKLSLTSPVRKEDILSVGREAAVVAYFEYNKSAKMTVRSWMLTIAEQRMCKYVRNECTKHHGVLRFCSKDQEMPDAICANLELEAIHFNESLLSLSTPSLEIIQLIFRMPLEIAKAMSDNKPKKTRGRLRDMLLSRGWKHRQIDRSFNEIKDFLKDTHHELRSGIQQQA